MYYTKSIRDTEKNLKTNIDFGLSEKEAQKRFKKYGENALKKDKRKSVALLFFEQFNDFLIIILIASACISFFTNMINHETGSLEPIVILAIVVLNAFLGMLQEVKAEKSIAQLKKMSSPMAMVKRNGEYKLIASDKLTVGDIVKISVGDVVPSDLRLFNSVRLEIDEASLTGESIPCEKNLLDAQDKLTPLAERTNSAYSGTFVTNGYGEGIVTEIGMNTELGKIADMLSDTEDTATPLQKKLDKLGRTLGIIALSICGIIFVFGVLKKQAPLDMFITSISLAVAAIPEGLPAIVTIMLSIGVTKMAKEGAIVRNLGAVETLGSADVICSDKTGTLTENKMTVKSVWGDEKKTLQLAVMCSAENTKNPTELAAVDYAKQKGIIIPQKKKTDELPFSSKTKEMRVLYNNHLVVKGAPEVVLKNCTRLSEIKRREIISKINKFADEGSRVIAVAENIDAKSINENKLSFCGLIVLFDPPRKDAVSSVKRCEEAGIRVVMITGDNPRTAKSIAKQIGMAEKSEAVVTGMELDQMSDEKLTECISKVSVFARTTPAHKVRIVDCFKRLGKITAMTGDGVNDAPALKKSDIGCSLGISGTDVAKVSSDIVLTDDNFSTIVRAIELGHEIYQNIRKAIKFLLSSNIGEIITVFFGIILGFPNPIPPMQLLWINLVTDSIPALALGVDPCEGDLIKCGKNGDSLFDKKMTILIFLEGMLIGLLGLGAFLIGINYYLDIKTARTMAFCTLSISQLFHAFNMRSEKSILGRRFFKNKLLLASLLVGILMQAGVVVFFPKLFDAVFLNREQWLIVAGLSIVPIIASEIRKLTKK